MSERMRCDLCGKFICHLDFDKGATHHLIRPDNIFNGEDYETICIKCNKEANDNAIQEEAVQA